MFDFEKLEVYQLVKEQTNIVLQQIEEIEGIDSAVRENWRNLTVQMLLQLVQASGRVNVAEKKNLLAASRSCVFESTAIIDLLKASAKLEALKFEELYNNYERISKMLLGMYRSYEGKSE